MAASMDSSHGIEITQTKNKGGKLCNGFRQTVAGLFGEADVLINGARPWDIVVHDERFYRRVLADGSLGLGESYMDQWWDCEAIDEMIARDSDNPGFQGTRFGPVGMECPIHL